MAVYKRILCQQCDAQLGQTQKETSKEWTRKRCKCGGSPRLASNWMASVYFLGTDGKQHRRTKTCDTKTEAEKAERDMLTERDNGVVYEKPKDHTLRSFIPIWKEWIATRVKLGKLAEGSAKSYIMRTDNHVVPAFGNMDMRTIGYGHVDNYIEQRLGNQVAQATVNREMATLKRILSIAAQKKVIRQNPLLGYELPAEDNELDRHLSHKEITALYAACQIRLGKNGKPANDSPPAHLLPIVTLMLNTGLRIEGVLTLKWEEIDWKANEIQKVVKGKTKVHIPMAPELRETLEQWRIRDGIVRMSGWVFPSSKKPDTHMLITSNFGLQTALKRANISDCTNHTMRHTFATIFLERYPEHIETLRVILGHSSSYITRRYAHLTQRTKHAVMATFSVTA